MRADAMRASSRLTAVVICASLVVSSACSSAPRISTSPTPPRVEDTNVEILAVQMDDGTRHEFERPAAFETLDSGREVLAGPVATTYDGQPASTRLYLDVAEITSYELTEKNDKSLGVFASITAVAIFIAMVLSGISIGP